MWVINEKRLNLMMFIFWLFTFPPVFYVAYFYFPILPVSIGNIVILIVLLSLTMLLPMKFQNSIVSMERWIIFTVFFQYGLLTEFILMQFAMIVLLLSDKSNMNLFNRFFINSSIFSVVSVGSAFVFHSLGGAIGSMDIAQIGLIGIVYAFTYTSINNFLMQIYLYFQTGQFVWIEKEIIWEVVITLLLFPFSISLYFLSETFGIQAVLLIGIPFLLFLVLTRRYNTSNNLKNKLSSATVLGHKLADNLGFQDVLESFLYNLKDVISYKEAYIIDFAEQKKLINLLCSENNVISKEVKQTTIPQIKYIDDGLDLHNTRIFATEKETIGLKYIHFSPDVESVVTSPIIREGVTEGFLILTSEKKNIFQPFEKDILDVLCGYLATSLVKARFYENTVIKSETCALTKLANFRRLETKLDEEMIRYQRGEIRYLSMIMLDIDHFKAINDSYGHQSGNDILCMIAELLKGFVEPGVTLARYGGEEFVFILPNNAKYEAVLIAEMIRSKVEQQPFRIIPDLSETRTPVDVNITLSLGVAAVPDDAIDAKDLLRNSDIAMYIGGKQSGRNRVGVFDPQNVESF